MRQGVVAIAMATEWSFNSSFLPRHLLTIKEVTTTILGNVHSGTNHSLLIRATYSR